MWADVAYTAREIKRFENLESHRAAAVTTLVARISRLDEPESCYTAVNENTIVVPYNPIASTAPIYVHCPFSATRYPAGNSSQLPRFQRGSCPHYFRTQKYPSVQRTAARQEYSGRDAIPKRTLLQTSADTIHSGGFVNGTIVRVASIHISSIGVAHFIEGVKNRSLQQSVDRQVVISDRV